MSAIRLLPLVGLFALSACSSTQSVQYSQPVYTSQPVQTAALPPSTNPAQTNAQALAMTDVSAFIDPTAASQLTANSRSQAAGAQYNQLQFGRPGAPRNWQGDNGQSGKVVVGPPLNVNALYCRSFTHDVVVGGQSFSKQGMACRAPDGRWTVDADTG